MGAGKFVGMASRGTGDLAKADEKHGVVEALRVVETEPRWREGRSVGVRGQSPVEAVRWRS